MKHLIGVEFLYWYTVQDVSGQVVQDSEHWIDKKHLEYWNECIDETFRPVDLKTEVVMIPEKIRKSELLLEVFYYALLIITTEVRIF
ncbi:DUF6176 family protein [Peribacillus butanolivorans]|uniref:DUF6176 family protein n=1 Tax=Peribacillus butanolivorans TaxID=421767 RepID=UPI0030C9970C